jgi:hypothetical protein
MEFLVINTSIFEHVVPRAGYDNWFPGVPGQGHCETVAWVSKSTSRSCLPCVGLSLPIRTSNAPCVETLLGERLR